MTPLKPIKKPEPGHLYFVEVRASDLFVKRAIEHRSRAKRKTAFPRSEGYRITAISEDEARIKGKKEYVDRYGPPFETNHIAARASEFNPAPQRVFHEDTLITETNIYDVAYQLLLKQGPNPSDKRVLAQVESIRKQMEVIAENEQTATV